MMSNGKFKKERKAFLHEKLNKSKALNYEKKELSKKIQSSRTNPDTRHKLNELLNNLIRIEAQVDSWDLDSLRNESGIELIEVETEETGLVGIRLITLDLEREIQSSGRIPVVFITGWSNDFRSPAAYTTSLAILSKRPVIVLSMPEHYTSIRPSDWAARLSKAGDYSLHSKLCLAVMRKLKLKEVDLQGQSSGAAIALTIAHDLSDGASDIKIRNLNVFNPTGFISKSWWQLAFDFVVVCGLQTLFNSKLRSKSMIVNKNLFDFVYTGGWEVLTKIVVKHIFTPEYLAKINVSGTFRLFFGEKDPLIPAKKAWPVFGKLKNLAPETKIQFIEMRNADHGMLLTKSAFFASAMVDEVILGKEIDAKKVETNLADLII